MRKFHVVLFCMLAACPAVAQPRSGKELREDPRRASDHVTEGWLLSYDNPDPERSWERIAGTLMIARRGTVIRRIRVAGEVRRWAFWRGGKEVAIEAGGLHGPSGCFLVSIASGRDVATVSGSCDVYDEASPAWVRALSRSGETQVADPGR